MSFGILLLIKMEIGKVMILRRLGILEYKFKMKWPTRSFSLGYHYIIQIEGVFHTVVAYNYYYILERLFSWYHCGIIIDIISPFIKYFSCYIQYY